MEGGGEHRGATVTIYQSRILSWSRECRLRAGGWPRETAEVWNDELGTLHSDELGDRAAACAHWRGHLRRFARGTYAPAVTAAMKRLECAR